MSSRAEPKPTARETAEPIEPDSLSTEHSDDKPEVSGGEAS